MHVCFIGCVIESGAIVWFYDFVYGIYVIIPAKAREYVFTGVGLCLCLCVCL